MWRDLPPVNHSTVLCIAIVEDLRTKLVIKPQSNIKPTINNTRDREGVNQEKHLFYLFCGFSQKFTLGEGGVLSFFLDERNCIFVHLCVDKLN